MVDSTLTLAVIHETFYGDDGVERLHARLREARGKGAGLAVLPELPLHPWVPLSREPRETDAEPPEGDRHRCLADAARQAGIGLLGGAIVRDGGQGNRVNRALLFDSNGGLLATYDKLHVPSEEGFWESDHYDEGQRPPERIDGFAMPLGIQICSDLNRPEGCHLLGAMGAEVILAPRATPRESYERWLLVGRANAITSCAYVVSTNRCGRDEPADGPSYVVAPDGTAVVETTDPLTVVRLERAAVATARRDYPGYLGVRASLYARAWDRVAKG